MASEPVTANAPTGTRKGEVQVRGGFRRWLGRAHAVFASLTQVSAPVSAPCTARNEPLLSGFLPHGCRSWSFRDLDPELSGDIVL